MHRQISEVERTRRTAFRKSFMPGYAFSSLNVDALANDLTIILCPGFCCNVGQQMEQIHGELDRSDCRFSLGSGLNNAVVVVEMIILTAIVSLAITATVALKPSLHFCKITASSEIDDAIGYAFIIAS